MKKANQTEVKSLIDTFTEMPIDQQTEVLGRLSEIHGAAKTTRANELMAELKALGISAPKVGKSPASRNSPAPKYRTPDGSVTWAGRGGIPKAFKALGVQTKEDMEKYAIQG